MGVQANQQIQRAFVVLKGGQLFACLFDDLPSQRVNVLHSLRVLSLNGKPRHQRPQRVDNAQIHALAAAVITALGLYLELHPLEWCIIIVCMAIVLLAEAINTALELLVDLVSPDYHPLAGKVKDVAAGAVLLSVLLCGVVWGIIYLPKLVALF